MKRLLLQTMPSEKKGQRKRVRRVRDLSYTHDPLRAKAGLSADGVQTAAAYCCCRFVEEDST